MGDVRADARGPRASASTGKRVARHAAEQALPQPYVGRRVARPVLVRPVEVPPTPEPAAVSEPVKPYVGRRVARVVPEPCEPVLTRPVLAEPIVAEPIAAEPIAAEPIAAEPIVAEPIVAVPVVAEPIVAEPIVAVPVVTQPIVIEPVSLQPAVPAPALPEPTLDLQAFLPTPEAPAASPDTTALPVAEPVRSGRPEHYSGRRVAPLPPRTLPLLSPDIDVEPTRPIHPLGADTVADAPLPQATRAAAGRRVADRRSRRHRMPSMPLLGGIAVLALSAGGALQAMSPDLAGSDAQHLAPASALSGSSAVASANLLGGRGAVVSRDSDRLQAAADAKVKERDQALSAFAAQAQKQAADIKLHQWVLPVAPGVYHLTARFGQYSYLWSNMHTGLDFAADTGTPIMAVAGGTITEIGYSGAYGNRTIETLPDGTELWYCHQNEFGTSVGATVRPGQVIGYVGSTGNVTGPHLHLEVHPGGGDPVDPYTALQVHGLQP